MAWVANAGGHTTARVRTATHSQTTLAAFRFSPASAAPGGARSRPPPLAKLPTGSLVVSAAAATAAGVAVLAAGNTALKSALALENPDRAAALMSVCQRRVYSAVTHRSAALASDVSADSCTCAASGLSDANSPTAASPRRSPNAGWQ